MWLLRRLSQDPTSPPVSPRQPPYSAQTYPRRRPPSPFGPPPLDPVVLTGYKATTPKSARLLSNALATEIRIVIPERLKLGEHWRLVYSLEQDGSSLGTLYSKAKAYEGRRVGFVLVIRDTQGGTFGGYLNEYPRPSHTYFGNGECFLWRASVLADLPPPPSADTTNAVRCTTIAAPPAPSFNSSTSTLGNSLGTPLPGQRSASPDPFESLRFKAFPYSGENDYCINCESGFLSMGAGAGGHYGLWIDDALEIGHSGICDTYGNEILSDEGEKFGILGVELWVIGTWNASMTDDHSTAKTSHSTNTGPDTTDADDFLAHTAATLSLRDWGRAPGGSMARQMALSEARRYS